MEEDKEDKEAADRTGPNRKDKEDGEDISDKLEGGLFEQKHGYNRDKETCKDDGKNANNDK